ncbi:MAG: hypothetical protein R3F47_12710 [Gammaproteobacteria bacterium]
MDSLLPTGFILAVLPAGWLLMQLLCWWLLFRMSPERFRSSHASTDFSRVADLTVIATVSGQSRISS